MKPSFLRYPIDKEGYAEAIEIGDSSGLRDKINQFGVCVIKLLTEPECQESVIELFKEINKTAFLHQKTKIDINNPETWETENWPVPNSKFLIRDFSRNPMAYRNRAHPGAYWVFSQLYQTDKVWSSIDTSGIMRGTFPENMSERKDWRVKALTLHWDGIDLRNPEHISGPALYQGLIALVDCPEEIGGFCCVPGSAIAYPEWLKDNTPDNNKYVPQNDPWQTQIQRFPLRAGNLIVWDRRTAHGNFSNHSPRMRLVQFLRMIPDREEDVKRDYRHAIREYFKADKKERERVRKMFNWTDTQLQVLSLKPWSESNI